jgi:hypothetical protein
MDLLPIYFFSFSDQLLIEMGPGVNLNLESRWSRERKIFKTLYKEESIKLK